jgi:hypothetical protein
VAKERVLTENLKRGYVGTAKTVERMHELAARSKLDPTLQRIATWIRLSVPEDYRGSSKATADAVFAWVRDHGVFQRDPFQIEKIEDTLASMQPVLEARKSGAYKGPALFTGDCDSYSVWVAALGGVLGYQYAFETAKVDAQRPDEFSHIWAALLVDGNWYALDPSTPGVVPGWRPQVPANRFKRWPEKPIEEINMSGMNGHGLNGVGDGDHNKVLPGNYYGYGIPRSFNNLEDPFIPWTGPGDIDELVPGETAVPRGDMEADLYYTKRVPVEGPSHRIGDYADIVSRRPNYVEDRGTNISTEFPYPEDHPALNDKRLLLPEQEHDYYFMSGQRIPVERRVEITMGPFSDAPEDVGFYGMGDTPASLTSMIQAEVQEGATKSVLDVVGDVFKELVGLLPGVAQEELDKLQDKYTGTVEDASGRVVESVAPPPAAAHPWYENPLVIAGGVVGIGGLAYLVMRNK